MTIEQLSTTIKSIMFANKPYGVQPFACIRDGNEIVLKKIQATDTLKRSIAELLQNTAKTQYLSDEAELEPAENISDNKKVLYEIEQTDLYNPFRP